MVSAARSGGVSRSDCRHVMKITTPYELRALIWDYIVGGIKILEPKLDPCGLCFGIKTALIT